MSTKKVSEMKVHLAHLKIDMMQYHILKISNFITFEDKKEALNNAINWRGNNRKN